MRLVRARFSARVLGLRLGVGMRVRGRVRARARVRVRVVGFSGACTFLFLAQLLASHLARVPSASQHFLRFFSVAFSLQPTVRSVSINRLMPIACRCTPVATAGPSTSTRLWSITLTIVHSLPSSGPYEISATRPTSTNLVKTCMCKAKGIPAGAPRRSLAKADRTLLPRPAAIKAAQGTPTARGQAAAELPGRRYRHAEDAIFAAPRTVPGQDIYIFPRT